MARPPKPWRKKPFRGVVVTGSRELDKALGLVVPTIANKALRKGSRDAAKYVATKARDRAPVGDEDDAHYHTVGASIKQSTPGRLKKAIKVRALPRSRTTTGAAVTVGDNLFTGDEYYAGFQELGWIHTGRGKTRGRGKKQEGQAFLRGALYDSADKVHSIYVHETKNKFDEIVRKILADSGGDKILRKEMR